MFLLRPPNLLRRRPFLERENVCNSQETAVRTRYAAIVNHPAVLKILRVVNLLRVLFLVRRGPLGWLTTGRWGKQHVIKWWNAIRGDCMVWAAKADIDSLPSWGLLLFELTVFRVCRPRSLRNLFGLLHKKLGISKIVGGNTHLCETVKRSVYLAETLALSRRSFCRNPRGVFLTEFCTLNFGGTFADFRFSQWLF